MLRSAGDDDASVRARVLYSRSAPAGDRRGAHRITVEDLVDTQAHVGVRPRIYICGSTGFVERAAGMLLLLGHPPANIRTERFGPSGR
jgi:ferredoxin-NADP reductase